MLSKLIRPRLCLNEYRLLYCWNFL